MTIKKKLCIGAVSLFLTCCTGSKKNTFSSSSLKETFKSNFLIGAALNAEQIEDKQPNTTLLEPGEFSSISAENIMKCEIIHASRDRYDFNKAEKLIAYCETHRRFIVAHNSTWHTQLFLLQS